MMSHTNQEKKQENIEIIKQKILCKIENTVFPEQHVLNNIARYSSLNIGKCLRGYLAFCFSKLINMPENQAILSGTIIELIHTFSLIHDDLPAIDNSDIRRGKPSCHIQFDEASAILIGVEILTKANLLASENFRIEVSREIHRSVSKLIEGQIEDIQSCKASLKIEKHNTINHQIHNVTLQQLEGIYIKKCGVMFSLSCTIPAIQAKLTKKQINCLKVFGNTIGIIFQLKDDIKDNTNTINIENTIGNTRKIEVYISNKIDEITCILKKNFSNNNVLAFFSDYIQIILNSS